MIPISYINGCYVLHEDAMTHIEDRGYQFGDGAYEVVAFRNRTLIDGHDHMQRLVESLEAIGISFKERAASTLVIMHQLIRKNRINDGSIYIQVTRGIAKRSHVAPKNVVPSVSMSIHPPRDIPSVWEEGRKVILRQDDRWDHCHIKSISLLANVMAKHDAQAESAWDSWYVNESGHITEGATCNAYMIKNRTIITHPANGKILGGITRNRLLALAPSLNLTVEERPFTEEELYQADEAFLSSSTAFVIPVVQVGERQIANGKRGQVTEALQRAYQDFMNI